ncbi:MAG: efflux RND transporter periplasmic adaptor subunit [Bryobacteraceae bacterium]|nr:efflux RND transporter periplasmic adaptor subunit [Bryobacteraceae bacterium]
MKLNRQTTVRALRRLVLIGLLTGAAVAVFGFVKMRQDQKGEELPSAAARRGEFSAIVRCRGELKARLSVQVVAPKNVPELRIVWLANQGTPIKEGDPVFRFDPSSAKQQLQEREAALRQAEAALEQAVANAHVSVEAENLKLAEAKHQVERAKLEVSRLEIVSRLQGEESRVDLALAENKLRVQEASVALDEATSEAKIASLRRARDKAKDDVEVTQYRLAQMEVKAPGNGMFHLLPNFSQGWMNAKPFKVGDQVWPGGALAEIPALDTIEMEGKIEEIDRGRIALHQDARVRIDSLPETTFPAKIEQLSPMTVMAWEWPPTRTFRGFAKITKPDPRLRPAMNGSIDVIIDRIPNATIIPSRAVFSRAGKPIVWVAEGTSHRAVEIKVLARNPDEVAIEGINESTLVALVEPELKGKV